MKNNTSCRYGWRSLSMHQHLEPF